MIEDSTAEIYRYGLARMLEIGEAVLTDFVICFGMGMVKEGLLFLVLFAPLRSSLVGDTLFVITSYAAKYYPVIF